MAWLSQHGYPFEERDITQNEAWFDELTSLGANATPTTFEKDNERVVIIDFDRKNSRVCLATPNRQQQN